jgi:hypothetical protein
MTKINSLAYKTIVLSVLFAYLLRKKKKISGRRKWVTDWLLQRESLSHVNLLAELKFGKTDWFIFLRMDKETYLKLLDQVSPLIQKHRTEAVSPHKTQTVTLRFLATGRYYKDLKFSAITSPQALNLKIPETIRFIYQVLRREHLKVSTGQTNKFCKFD